MRCLYREVKYFCGDYLDVALFPAFNQSNSPRQRKAKPTREAQVKLNQINAELKFERLVYTNFTPSDIRLDLTFRNELLPDSDEAAKKDLRNFINRLKRFRACNGLDELRYIVVTEKSARGRYHYHMIINGDISPADYAEIWGKGYTGVKPLQFDNDGLPQLCAYMLKGSRARAKKQTVEKNGEPGEETSETIGNRWSASRNLKQPTVRKRDGRISARRAVELWRKGNDARADYEKLYPGYSFSFVKPFYNDINGGVYIMARLRKIPQKKTKPKGGGKAK